MRFRDKEHPSKQRVRGSFLEEGMCVFDLHDSVGWGQVQVREAGQVL